MNCNTCEPLLSVYIEQAEPGRRSLGEGGQERAGVEAHLRTCGSCRALAEDLRAIRLAARSLEPLVPPARVWHRIAAAAEAEPRVSWLQSGWLNWRPLTAVAMTALIAASLWRVGTLLGPAAAPPSSAGTTVADVAPASAGLGPESDYTLAIAQLEQVTNADRDVLDQDTAGVLNAGLTVIDGAISESRAALEAEPQSQSAQESLFAALRRKVSLLQDTVALINEMRNGNQDGSARILPESNR
ncbi:MAG TPA: hypothetical protein VM846_13860 [Vicinamibacterales bacterium]|nr:hypothetical protein [Vicinamibacterales bacterium]